MVLAAFCFLARGTDSDDVDSVAFRLKASRQPLQCREDAEILFFDVSDGLAMSADHVVVKVAVQLYANGTVVHADFFEHASLDEEMNVFVNRREGDCGYTFLDPCVDLFRAGMARHRLHNFIENLALVGCCEPVIRTKFTEGTGLDAGRDIHQELVNDNYSRSSRMGDFEWKRV
jgi:hypothetical protein